MSKRFQFKKVITFCLTVLYWGLMTFAWSQVWDRYYGDIIVRPFGYKGTWLVVAVYGLVLFLFTRIYGGYRIGYHKFGDVVFSNLLALVFTNGITYLQTCLLGAKIMDVRPIMVLCAAGFLLSIAWAYVSTKLYMKLYPPHKMLMIYGGKQLTESLIYKMLTRPEKYSICEAVSVDDGLESIIERIKNYTAVIICDVKTESRNKILKHCFEHSIRTYITPKISDIIVRGASDINLFDTPLLLCRNYGLTMEQRIVKRAIDLFISTIGIILSSPFMLGTAIAIKLYDKGPALFKQERATIHNKVFTIYKFRSMIVDAEKDGKPRPAVDNDPRITPVGAFIRKTRLDELPQLFNIFLGDMSIVGPRPERVEHVEKYSEEIPEFAFRSKVKAGLTGYAQIIGRYNTSAYDKLKMDLMYIENYSTFEDLKLILMTIKIMFVKDSTAGFEKKEAPAAPPAALPQEGIPDLTAANEKVPAAK